MDFFPYPQNFMAGIYDFTVVFRKNSEFESYPGPFFRSVFGKVMREKFCTEGDTKCILCSKNKICAYSILHEAPFDKKIELEFGISQTNLPKPFFMTPITEYPCKYKAGESMNVEVVFIGNSIKYLKEAVSCFVQAGNCGIDKNRYKFDLLSISDSISKKNIYEKGKYSSEKMVMYSAQTEKDEMELTSVGIHFLTPLRLQSEHRLIKNINFSDIWTTLLKRTTILSSVYGGKIANSTNIKKSIEISKNVKKKEDRTRLKTLERYSATQETTLPLDGITGKMVFSGVPKGFLPILKMGEIIHMGKGLTSGLGKYKLNIKSNRVIIAGGK